MQRRVRAAVRVVRVPVPHACGASAPSLTALGRPHHAASLPRPQEEQAYRVWPHSRCVACGVCCGWCALREVCCGWCALREVCCGWCALREVYCGWCALREVRCGWCALREVCCVWCALREVCCGWCEVCSVFCAGVRYVRCVVLRGVSCCVLSLGIIINTFICSVSNFH